MCDVKEMNDVVEPSVILSFRKCDTCGKDQLLIPGPGCWPDTVTFLTSEKKEKVKAASQVNCGRCFAGIALAIMDEE